jgi:hypothetical protein
VAVEWKEGAGDRFIDPIPKDALEEIRDSQGEVLRLLREMESRFRLLSERQSWLENGRSLLDEQQALGESLSAFPDRATGLPLEMLSPAEQSTLTDWGEQQRRLAERLMELSRHDGEEATRFATLYRRMLETASAMEKNRLGEARQKIDDIVRALVSLLNGSDRSDTARSTEPAVLTNGRFAQVCARLAEHQATLLDETKKIDRKLDALGGSISRTEAFALAGLAEEQELLAEKTREAAARRKNEPIWTALMRNASEKMEEATRFLQSQRTGPDCRNCQKQAIELLRWFLAAEKATGDTETTAMNPTSDQGETETTRSQTDLGRQLRILQALQRVLLHDTTRVDAARSTWETSKLNEEIQSLGTRQSLLAERTERLGSLFNREEMETMESTLAALAGMMGSVASRLTEGQVGPSIRQQQEEILEILLRLQGKSNGPPPGHDSGTGETTGQEEGSGKSEGPTSEGEGEASGGDPTSGTAAGREKNGSDRSSADRESNELTLSEMGEVWGELPLKTRRRLGRFRRENFLPEYREMIESYYRRLSERGPKDKWDEPQERGETERRRGERTE